MGKLAGHGFVELKEPCEKTGLRRNPVYIKTVNPTAIFKGFPKSPLNVFSCS